MQFCVTLGIFDHKLCQEALKIALTMGSFTIYLSLLRISLRNLWSGSKCNLVFSLIYWCHFSKNHIQQHRCACCAQQELFIVGILITLESFAFKMKFMVVGFLILGLSSVKTETELSDESSDTKKASKLVSNAAKYCRRRFLISILPHC